MLFVLIQFVVYWIFNKITKSKLFIGYLYQDNLKIYIYIYENSLAKNVNLLAIKIKFRLAT
jgi:hypothetical protein